MKRATLTRYACSSIRTLALGVLLCVQGNLNAEPLNPSEYTSPWVNGRAFVQHLHALQSTPQSLFLKFSNPNKSDLSKSFNECLARVSDSPQNFSDCTRIALAEVRDSFNRREPISKDLLAKTRIYSAVVESTKLKQPWDSWLNLAAIEVMAGDFQSAGRYLSTARSSASDAWVLARLDLFGHGLSALLPKQDDGAKPVSFASAPRQQSDEDSQTSYLRSKIEQSVGILERKDNASGQNILAEKRLNDLTRERWILMQDRVELDELKKAVVAGNLSMDIVRRIDSLFLAHGLNDKTWRAIVSSMVSVLARGEGLATHQGLSLAVESWLQGSTRENPLLAIDDDKTLDRYQLILNIYTSHLGLLLEEIAVGFTKQNERALALALSERMRGMLGSVSQTINNLNAQEKFQVSIGTKRTIASSGERLRRTQAVLAARELTSPESNPQITSQMKDFRDEIKDLQIEREEIISELMSSTIQLIPMSLAQFDELSLRIDQVKKSIEDLRRVVSASMENKFIGSQASYFMIESIQFLDRLAAEARNRISDKREQNKSVAVGFKAVNSAMSQLRKQMDDFVASQSGLLSPRVLATMTLLESELISRDRSLEVREQIAKSEIRDGLRKDIENERLSRERINDLRRIRSENLEWRFGR